MTNIIKILGLLIIVSGVLACVSPLPPTLDSAVNPMPTVVDPLPTIFESANVAATQPTADNNADCIDAALLIENVTIPPDSELPAGQPFEKTWRLANNGSCAWETNYTFKPIGAVTLAGSPLFLPKLVLPSEQIELTVQMIAPQQAGQYQSEWQLFNAQGEAFGPVFLVRINSK